MKKTILTTAVQNFNAGMVADGNTIEYPPNSARLLKNVKYRDDDVIVRRPGLGKSSTWTSNDQYAQRSYLWEYSPGAHVVVTHDYENISVRRATDGTILASWGPWQNTGIPSNAFGDKERDFMVSATGNNTISYAYTKEAPTGSAAVASTNMEFFNQLAAARAAGTVTISQDKETGAVTAGNSAKTIITSFTYSGNKYIRKSSYTSLPPGGVSPNPSVNSLDSGSWYQFASLRNTCVLTTQLGIAWVIWADTSASSVTFLADFVDMKRRIYEDFPDGVGVDEQPVNTLANTELNDNLLNRGWLQADINAYKTAQSKWPSKSMVPWLGKDGTGVFDSNTINKVFFGTSSAPTGKLFASVYEYDKTGVTAVCSAFGRYFYGGTASKGLGNAVLYSQIITDSEFIGERVGACYAVNDPTAEHGSEPTSFDGGYIIVEGASQISRLVRYMDGILIFASNGVWYLTGISGQVFQGNAFNIYKVTDKGALNGHAVAELDSIVMYCSGDGIYASVVDPQSRSVAFANVTDNRISKLYKELLAKPLSYLPHAIAGGADKIDKDIYFLFAYNDINAGAGNSYYTEDKATGKMLVFNLARGSWRYYETTVATANQGRITGTRNTPEGRILLTDPNARPYQFNRDDTASASNYLDDYWTSANSSTLLTAQFSSQIDISAKNAMVDPDKELVNVTTNFVNSDYKIGSSPIVTGSCKMTVLWDAASESNTVRHTSEQQAYRNVPRRVATSTTVADKFANNYTKLLVRGHGRQFLIRYKSEGVAEFKLIGYSLDIAYPTRELTNIARGS